MSEGLGYLTQIWNYLDTLPPLLIYLLILDNFIGMNTAYTATIMALATVMMWLKLLYFMRIFKNTGYLIRMIIEVISDMKYFLFILMVTVTAIGDAMLKIANQNKGEERFVKGFFEAVMFTYRMILGDFDTEKFGSVSVLMVWFLFLLCTVLNMIVMLNLLIAIISESFNEINQFA